MVKRKVDYTDVIEVLSGTSFGRDYVGVMDFPERIGGCSGDDNVEYFESFDQCRKAAGAVESLLVDDDLCEDDDAVVEAKREWERVEIERRALRTLILEVGGDVSIKFLSDEYRMAVRYGARMVA